MFAVKERDQRYNQAHYEALGEVGFFTASLVLLKVLVCVCVCVFR